MATQFQHRLVGTIILVALGVIFLPDLLDGKPAPMPEEVVTIPLRPELEPARPVVAVSPPAQPEAPEGDRPDVWTLEPVREAPPEPPRPASTPAPEARPVAPPADGDFIVQLGAFRNADNVNALVKKLQAAGYRVQTTPAVPRQGVLNRVWIGPDAKARLQQQLPALERLTGLKGRVMSQ